MEETATSENCGKNVMKFKNHKKQHGIIKCDRNVWNVLHVWKKSAHRHKLACIGVHWAQCGRRHENACKITERKNGNTARTRATVNVNNKKNHLPMLLLLLLLLLKELAVGSVSVSVVWVLVCAIADGRIVDVCVENAACTTIDVPVC